MIIIVMIILWLAYCITDGLTDGFAFNKSYLANNFNNQWCGLDIHIWFTIKRAITFIAIVFTCYLYSNIEVATLVFISNMLVFPFLHDGTMYQSRKKSYHLGFLHDPTINDTSTAKINISTPTRILFFILGISLYFAVLLV